MSSLESRLEALEREGADRVVIALWLLAPCPACGVNIWKERTTGRTRNVRAGEDFRVGIYRAASTPPPAHGCKGAA